MAVDKALVAEMNQEIERLRCRVAELERERDAACAAAEAMHRLVTPPISESDIEWAIAEARRIRPAIDAEQSEALRPGSERTRGQTPVEP